MDFKLIPIEKEDIVNYKKDMQEAFQKGAMAEYNDLNVEILPEKDIDESLSRENVVAYKAMEDGKMIGGAVVVIDENTRA